MKESIYTIPISEVFEPRCGCPICALHTTLETRWVDYITGAAMMEPDIRIETNKEGFCPRHFDRMLAQRNRLSVALILQSRLEHLNNTLTDIKSPKKGLFGGGESTPESDCFVCGKIDREFDRIADNIVTVWGRDQGFRKLYTEQEFLCYPHYKILVQAAKRALGGKQQGLFVEESAILTRNRLGQAKKNIDQFCNLFDYRSAAAGKPSDEVSAAIESAIAYLGGASSPLEDEK